MENTKICINAELFSCKQFSYYVKLKQLKLCTILYFFVTEVETGSFDQRSSIGYYIVSKLKSNSVNIS